LIEILLPKAALKKDKIDLKSKDIKKRIPHFKLIELWA